MTRNTKEVALIQHRTGELAGMPKSLHQSEFGLAKDANRLFIGNASNTILANRTQFPYQNLEILTEYSNLKDYFKYSYENNITNAGTETDRSKLKEYLPIVVTCSNSFTGLSVGGTVKLNGQNIVFATGDTMEQVANKFNSYSSVTNTYVSISKTTPNVYLTFVCLNSALEISNVDGTVLTHIGFPTSISYDISMPERKVTEKLDDILHITDFGVKGDGVTNYSSKIYSSLEEIYKNYSDNQFYRNVMFPAGTYNFDSTVIDTSNNTAIYVPFPLISNLHVHGEGIDRTIIKATTTETSYILLNCVDNKLNPETAGNYGDGNYPNNILVEDMTFESNLSVLGKISSGSNITFNRVKFKSETTTILMEIIGNSNNYAGNITFNECIFEGGAIGLQTDYYVENVTVTNCLFKNITTHAMKFGNDTYSVTQPCRGFNIDSNIIKNTPTATAADTYAIYIANNAKYMSFHQTQFDESLFTNWAANNYPIPFRQPSTENNNYIDTLDPRTDEKKVLKFHFTQPKWEYLDYLINSSGNVVIKVDGNDSDITATNGLHIKEDNTGVDIRSVKTGNVTLSLANNADVILGEGTDTTTGVTGNIQVKKTIVLNDNKITNNISNGNDIVIETATNKIIRENQPTGSTPYEQLVLGQNNAIPNVAYVDMVSNQTFEKIITSADLVNYNNGSLPLITFSPETFGSNIHLKRISINVRTPFYKVFEHLSKAAVYDTGLMYYKGDVVISNTSGTVKYGVVTNTHQATSQSIDPNQNVVVIPNSPSLKSVKYAEMVGVISGIQYSLTKTYSENFTDPSESYMTNVDIQKNNKFGYDSCPEFVDNTTVGDVVKIFDYCDRNYTLSEGTYTLSDLHDADKALRKYDEGYNYVFDMDRNYNNGTASIINPTTLNFADNSIILKLYDTDGNIITSFTNKGQLNPGGEMIIRIEYTRNEV